MTYQLAFDVAPAHAVAVGDRVRVHQAYSPWLSNVRAGMMGTVVDVRPRRTPCLNGGYWECHPVAVAIDDLGGRVYAFEYEDLEVVDHDPADLRA